MCKSMNNFACLESEDLSSCVQEVICSASPQQKARWFHDAFRIPRLSWVHILKEWQSHLPNTVPVEDVDSMDSGDSMDTVEEKGQVLVIPDPSSETITSSELWHIIWRWFPEWVLCKEPQCVFRASRDGYKYVILSDKLQGLRVIIMYSLRTLYRMSEGMACILLVIKSANTNVMTWS